MNDPLTWSIRNDSYDSLIADVLGNIRSMLTG